MENLNVYIHVSPGTFLRDPNISKLGRRILAGSIELIDELGFEDFTFKKLGERIGSPESSIYRYFESKHMILVYLTYWYWNWIEYKLVFATINLNSEKKKLEKAINILTESVEQDGSIAHINEVVLYRIIMNEGVKAYHTKEVDRENEKGYFKVYKQVVQRVCNMILKLNPTYEFPHMLISTVIEGAHKQRYFAEHIPALTDITQKKKDSIPKFYKQLVFNAIK